MLLYKCVISGESFMFMMLILSFVFDCMHVWMDGYERACIAWLVGVAADEAYHQMHGLSGIVF
jgi:hypothetical protein